MSGNTLIHGRDGTQPTGTARRATRLARVRFRIDELTCAAEAVGIEHRLIHQAGVADVTVNPITEIAYVAYDPGATDPATLRRHIEDAGFGVDET
jgi:cation transport ATPase